MFCKNCGTELNQGQIFCPKCGAPTGAVPGSGQNNAGMQPPSTQGQNNPGMQPSSMQGQNNPGMQPPPMQGQNNQSMQAPIPGSMPPRPGQPVNEESEGGSGIIIALIVIVSILLVIVLAVGAYFLFIVPKSSTDSGSEKQVQTAERDTDDDITVEDPTTLATEAESAKEYAEDSGLDLEKDKEDGKIVYVGYDDSIEVGTTENGDGFYVFQGMSNDAFSFLGVQIGMTKGDAKAAIKESGYSYDDEKGKLKVEIDKNRRLTVSYSDGEVESLDYVYIPKKAQRPADESSSAAGGSADSGSSASSSAGSDSASAPSRAYGDAEDFILPQSGTEYIDEHDIAFLTPWEVKLAKNEIYARWGAHFKTREIRDHFNSTSWYVDEGREAESCTSYMNKYELANIDFLRDHE